MHYRVKFAYKRRIHHPATARDARWNLFIHPILSIHRVTFDAHERRNANNPRTAKIPKQRLGLRTRARNSIEPGRRARRSGERRKGTYRAFPEITSPPGRIAAHARQSRARRPATLGLHARYTPMARPIAWQIGSAPPQIMPAAAPARPCVHGRRCTTVFSGRLRSATETRAARLRRERLVVLCYGAVAGRLVRGAVGRIRGEHGR